MYFLTHFYSETVSHYFNRLTEIYLYRLLHICLFLNHYLSCFQTPIIPFEKISTLKSINGYNAWSSYAYLPVLYNMTALLTYLLIPKQAIYELFNKKY